jgi:hypothetical protein
LLLTETYSLAFGCCCHSSRRRRRLRWRATTSSWPAMAGARKWLSTACP